MTSPPPAIPETPEELTAGWLRSALDWPVDSVSREVLGVGQGFLGDIIRLRLESSSNQVPATVIVKMPKKANRAMGEMLGVYEREVLFFREYGDTLPARIPQIYFSHYDPDAGSAKQREILALLDRLPRFCTPAITALGKKVAAGKTRRYLLVMEDLGEYQPGDQFAGAPVETCARVLEQFAVTHRRYWNDAGLTGQFWLLPMDVDARMREGMLRRTLPAFQAIAGDVLEPYVIWLGENNARLLKTFTAEAPSTLVHCDLRLDNVCFDGSTCAFLDWQLIRAGPAAYDVAYFLGGALPADASEADEDEILSRYHRALGIADYPFEQFLRDYQRALLLSLASVMPSEDFAIDEGRGRMMMDRWRARLTARLKRVDVGSLL